jgi:chromosome segregation ATPase
MASRQLVEKKERIIRDLKGEIAEMQLREKEYQTCVEQLQALESQVDAMRCEKSNLESRKKKLQADTEAESSALKEQLRMAKHSVEDKQRGLDKATREKARLEETCLHKKKELGKLGRDIEEILERNNTLESKIQAYRRQTIKKEEENKEMDQKVNELMGQLERLTEHNRQLERELCTLDSEIVSLREEANHLEDEKEAQLKEYEKKKQKHHDNGRSIQSLETELLAVEKEIKQLRSINDNYKNELLTSEKAYQSQLKKNHEIIAEQERLEVEKR